ncbi:hypothetical protein [Fredinandcohnia sp. 179-A 10B2 NHS]|uniref:hypothetical protein n=1 Tax=Fredinandcohnia sp. 179-A 10B2 NHS TaxID=3235176 RepID=UPI0039A25D8D
MEIFILFALLVVGILLFVLLPLWAFNKGWRVVSVGGSLLVSIALFYLISLMTIDPTSISGNGNLAILVMPFAVASYVGTLLLLYKIEFNLTFLIRIVCTIGILLLVIGEVIHVQNLVDTLGGGPDIPDSRIYRFGWFNQYTNTFYFNGYIFAIGILLVVGVFRKK